MSLYEMKIKCSSKRQNVNVQRRLNKVFGVRWGINLDVWTEPGLRWDYLIIIQNKNPTATHFGKFFFTWATTDDFAKAPVPEVTPKEVFKQFR